MQRRIRTGTHDMDPESLGDRHSADQEVLDFYRSRGRPFSERIRMVVRASDEGEIERITLLAGVPGISRGRQRVGHRRLMMPPADAACKRTRAVKGAPESFDGPHFSIQINGPSFR